MLRLFYAKIATFSFLTKQKENIFVCAAESVKSVLKEGAAIRMDAPPG